MNETSIISREWENIAEKTYHRWINLNCFEAADEKHIAILTQKRFGSDFHNYKAFYSMVLLVFVDYDYCFLAADPGAQEQISDDDVFKIFAMYLALENDKLNSEFTRSQTTTIYRKRWVEYKYKFSHVCTFRKLCVSIDKILHEASCVIQTT